MKKIFFTWEAEEHFQLIFYAPSSACFISNYQLILMNHGDILMRVKLKFLGHKILQMIRFYTHFSDGTVSNFILKMNPNISEST